MFFNRKFIVEVVENNSYVTISNELIRGVYPLSGNEMRVLWVAMAKTPKLINKGKKKLSPEAHAELFNRHIDPNKPYYITTKDFIDLGIDPSNAIKSIRAGCDDLMKKQVTITTKVGEFKFNWVRNAFFVKTEKFEELKQRYINNPSYRNELRRIGRSDVIDTYEHIINSNENIVARIVFTPETLQYIALLHEKFAGFPLRKVGFSSFYSFRIYLFMMAWKDTTNEFFTTLDNFKYMLGLGVGYDRIPDLKKRVLDVAMKEINEISDYNAEYELTNKKGQSGRGIKVTDVKITFNLKPNAKVDLDISQNRALPPLITQANDIPFPAPVNPPILEDFYNTEFVYDENDDFDFDNVIPVSELNPTPVIDIVNTTSKPNSKPPKKADDDLTALGIDTKPVDIHVLIGLGVEAQVAHDFLVNKKGKAITRSALNYNIKQAKLAGLTLNEALSHAGENSWTKFTASFYLDNKKKTEDFDKLDTNKRGGYRKNIKAKSENYDDDYPVLASTGIDPVVINGEDLYNRIVASDEMIEKFINGNTKYFNEKSLAVMSEKQALQDKNYKSLMQLISYRFKDEKFLKFLELSMIDN